MSWVLCDQIVQIVRSKGEPFFKSLNRFLDHPGELGRYSDRLPDGRPKSMVRFFADGTDFSFLQSILAHSLRVAG